MKKNNYLLSTLAAAMLLLHPFTADSQTWLQDGQTWQYYVFGGFIFDNYGTHTLQVTGDTVVQGKSCKVVTHFPLVGNPFGRFVYEEGDKVYEYDSFSETFHKIYDFTLSSGGIVQMKSGSYTVSSTGEIEINGINRRYQIAKFGSSSNGRMIIEGIGMVGKPHLNDPLSCSYFFPQGDFYCSAAFDGWNVYFRCFSGENFYYSPFDECTLTADTLVPEPGPPVQVYPNPVSDYLRIETEGVSVMKASIYGLRGQTVWQGQPENGEIDLRSFPTGLFFVKCLLDDGSVYSQLISVWR